MKIRIRLVFLTVVVCFLWAEAAFPIDLGCDDLGVRAGISFSTDSEDFEEYDIFARWDLPWRWQFSSGLTLATRIEAAAGVLYGENDSALLLEAGPVLRVSAGRCPVGLDLGFAPAFVSEDEYAETDIGGNLQFIGQATLFYVFGDRFHLGYRIQHMSNGGIESPNPGINMHMLEITFRF